MLYWKTKDSKVQTRSIDVPEKVFIEREGLYWEYSEEPPASLKHNFHNLLNGFYSCQNFIELFNSVPEVFAPVHEIAKRVSDANWQLCKEWNDEVDYNDADFNRLFTQPNPYTSFKDLVYQAVCYEILTGKQLFFFNKPEYLPNEYKSIITWSNLPAHKVRATLKKNVDPFTATSISDFVSNYTMPIEDGKDRVFPVSQVLPICHFNLKTGYNPNDVKSLLSGAEKAIRNLIPVYEARGIIYIKRGAMGMWVSQKSDASGVQSITPKEKKDARDAMNASYGLTGNRDTIGITTAPIRFEKTSMSIAEMQPFEETLADAVAIYATLRVPRSFVPSKDNSTFNNKQSDERGFYQDVIIPWAKRYAESWTNYMGLKNFRRYINADFSHVQALQENRKEKADVDKVNGDTYLQRFLNGAGTLNEWIVAHDGNKSTLPLYDKKIFEMDETELAQVKAAMNLKAVAPIPANNDQNNINGNPTAKN